MKRYTYRIMGAPVSSGCPNTIDLINELGNRGYELISIQDGLMYFKREEEQSGVEVGHPAPFTPVGIHQPVNYNLRDMEKKYIEECILKHEGKIAASAEELGIATRTLYRRLEEYNLNHLLPRKGNI